MLMPRFEPTRASDAKLSGILSRYCIRKMIDGPYSLAKAAIRNDDELPQCSRDWSSNMGMPCRHDCEAFIRGHRRHPFGRDEFSTHWLLSHEKDLIDEARTLGRYQARIDPVVPNYNTIRLGGGVAPQLRNAYVDLDNSAMTIDRTQRETILDPVRETHLGRLSEYSTSQGTRQGINTAEVLQGVVAARPVARATVSSGRPETRAEEVERQTSRKQRRIDTCTACNTPGHRKNNKNCPLASVTAQRAIETASQQGALASQAEQRQRQMERTLSVASMMRSDDRLLLENVPWSGTLAPHSQPSTQGFDRACKQSLDSLGSNRWLQSENKLLWLIA